MKKTKKKNKALPLVVLLVLLLAVIGAYIWVQNLSDNTAETEGNEDTVISLSNFTQSDITSITYSWNGDVKLVNGDGKWYLEGNEKFPLDQSLAAKMAEAVSTIAASREVGNGELAEFGLDSPVFSLKVALSNGNEYSYSLGDVNSYNEMTYILAEEKVYVFDDILSANFPKTIDELMLIVDSFPSDITPESIVSATYRDAEGNEFRCADVSSSYATLKKCFSFDEVSSYGLTDEELASLGISENGAIVTISYTIETDTSDEAAKMNATFSMLLGEQDGKFVYARKNGDMTYDLDVESFNSMFAVELGAE